MAASLAAAGVLLAGPASTPAPAQGSAAKPQTRADDAMELPAVAEAVTDRVAVRRAPRPAARRIAIMRALRFDFRPTSFLVSARRLDRQGREWLRVDVPGPIRGVRGWVRGAALRIIGPAGPFVIEVRLRKRRLVLRRNGRRVLSAPVAIGKPSAPSPVGRYYITAVFRPSDPFLGDWAFETSAHSNLSDWPRGGIVGLHGTNRPELIGRRVSSGCIRMHNHIARALRKRVRPGTPLIIRR